MSEKSSNNESSKEMISLSAALLAPINSIFEAQIHSARAFLNFILQMGFRHQKTVKEFNNQKDFDDHVVKVNEKKAEMRKLFKERGEKGFLSEDQTARLKELDVDYGDLYNQSIDFIDSTGNDFQLSIPNLALLPIKPLAISEAHFSYEFEIDTEKEVYKQNGASIDADKDEGNPWFLIKHPKSLRGSFAERKEESSKRTIKINVKVGNTDIPYGLEKLLVHLTNNIESIDKAEN